MGDEGRVISARFVGADGSLGYRNGLVYDLYVWSTTRYPVVIRRMDGGYCPYSSEVAFGRNWEIVDTPPANHPWPTESVDGA